MNIDFSVRDDANEPTRLTGGTYQWNNTGVNLGMRWNWLACCTDGGAISGELRTLNLHTFSPC